MQVIFHFMKPKPGLLSPLIRSDVQGLILARLFMAADTDFTITELAEQSFTSVPTAMREVDRLVEAEYVTDRAFGRVRLIRANSEHPLFGSIFQIVAHSYGPAALLPRALSNLFGLKQAFIYGEWAERLSQKPGPTPRQLHLLLVGNMNRIDASKAVAAVEGQLGRVVNLQFVSAEDWASATNDFIRSVRANPILELQL
jgi:hypothetical protein